MDRLQYLIVSDETRKEQAVICLELNLSNLLASLNPEEPVQLALVNFLRQSHIPARNSHIVNAGYHRRSHL